MELDTINFSRNWNNKLRCYNFTTIRLGNEDKYKKGKVLNISLDGYPKGKAKIVGITYLTIGKINDWIAKLDTRLSATECRDLIKTMYKNRPQINWDIQELAYLLLEWQGQERMNDLFETPNQ